MSTAQSHAKAHVNDIGFRNTFYRWENQQVLRLRCRDIKRLFRLLGPLLTG